MRKVVLVIDDSATVRGQVRAALDPSYDIVEACDGIEGLDRYRSSRVAMIICDVNMPRMNGLEMIEQLKVDGCGIPIVMLTTEGQTALIARAREAGARGWIVKPFNPDLLRKAVDKLTVSA